MRSTYYSAAWTDSGCLLDCGHEHETLADAASCIPSAGGYVVGIESGVMRSLRTEEESEFQSVIRGHSTTKPAPYTTVLAAASEKASSDPGYAVINQIRVVDHWTWATGMCFETYAQAVAHARKGDKVVRFSSEEWLALRQRKWAEQPQQTDTAPPIHTNSARETLLSRLDGEPLGEYVLRLLSALDPAEPLPIKSQKDSSLTSESDKQTSMIEENTGCH
jgi:hypothetical protein